MLFPHAFSLPARFSIILHVKQMDSIIHLESENETSFDSFFVCHFSKQHTKKVNLGKNCRHVFTIVPSFVASSRHNNTSTPKKKKVSIHESSSA
jgi:hypothetical protein